MFTAKCDGNWIYNPALGFHLINPVLTLEDSCAGSFEFTMSPDHAEYENVKAMTSKVVVYRDGTEIWQGRPLNMDTDFYKQKKVFCEGELAILNDTIQPPAEYHNTSVQQWLTAVLNIHNAKVSDDKKFYVGNVTVVDNLYRYTNYENTLEAINDKLLSRLGGHLKVRWSGGKRYLDYLKSYPKASSQVIRFGQNLVDYSTNFNQTDIATAIIPLGAKLDDSPIEALDAYLDVKSVNGGSIYVQNTEAVRNFGWICKTVRWDDVTIASNLLEKARQYLTNFQYDTMCLTVKAVDFHLLDNGIPALDLLDEVRVISNPHGLDRLFPVTKLIIPLEEPGNMDITMGTVVQQSLTSRSSAAIQGLKDAIEAIPTESSILQQAKENATQLIISGALGSHVVVKPDEIYIMNTDDEKTATRVWRWNVNGLGYSSTGINGRYDTAITMDGRIVADYITTGTMYADRIKGGTLGLGGASNGNGVIKMYDSTGKTIGQWDNTGFYANYEDGNVVINKNGYNFYYKDCEITQGTVTFGSGSYYVPVNTKLGAQLYTYKKSNSERWETKVHPAGLYAHHWVNNLAGDFINLDLDLFTLQANDRNIYFSTVTGKFAINGNHYLRFDLETGEFIVDGKHVAYQSTSSKRYKHDIKYALEDDLNPEKLYELPVAQFVYNEEVPLQYNDMEGQTIPGIIAEDVEDIYPSAVIHDSDGKVESWDERRIIPPMLALIQKQNEQIKMLENRVSALEKKLQEVLNG